LHFQNCDYFRVFFRGAQTNLLRKGWNADIDLAPKGSGRAAEGRQVKYLQASDLVRNPAAKIFGIEVNFDGHG
jgi:hypothetical protein